MLGGGAGEAAAGRWTLAPAAVSGSRPYVYAEGAPGSVLEDKVAVSNPSAGAVRIRLRASGARIVFAEPSVRVPARTRAEVPFALTVPAGASPGDHPGTIVAEGAGHTSRLSVHLRVSGPTLAALTVEHVRVVAGDRITYDVVNRGNTTLAPRLAVTADGVLGTVLDRKARTLPVRLPPGRRASLSEPWRDAPALDAVEVRVTVTAGDGARDTATANARFVPWAPLGAALAALAGAGYAAHRLVRRRRRVRPSTGNPGSVS
ncbi:hypothetical protein [Streptomyces sp. NPDC049813]|uniref:hypothetical protein n=1 Tax=Streptomyces sp. NPDC049813 TaxID=3365597 RepID=UPI0037B63116